jgi:hypothetical protein
MAIRAYFDESEDSDAVVHSIGGFIGFAEQWDKLQFEWTARVKPTGIRAFHLTDCESGWGEFRDWPKEERKRLTIDLIDIILKHEVFMIGAVILLGPYNDLPALTGKGNKLGGDKWLAGFQAVIQDAASQASEVRGDESVEFFFDRKIGYVSKAQAIIDEFRDDARLGDWRKKIGTITFGSKEFDAPDSIPLLQVADIAAVETRKAVGNPLTHPHLPERKSMMRFKEENRITRIYKYDQKTLQILYDLKKEEIEFDSHA